MPVLRYPAAENPGSHHPDTLIVFLPGRKDRANVFAQEAMLDVVRQHGLAFDMLATDAHAGYYISGSLVRQLDQEVIEPAHRRGYRHIILVGVSLGGYGAVRYAMAHPGFIQEVVLLSPFLGTGPFMRELAEAGDEDFVQTWDWLRRYPLHASDEQRAKDGYPRLILGYGQEDLFLHTDNLLSALLPPDDVVTTAGAHLWSTWRTLLKKMLEKGLLDGSVKQATAPG